MSDKEEKPQAKAPAEESPQNTQPKERVAASVVLLNFLKREGIDFIIRKQRVRFMEDNGMVIDAPTIAVFYKKQTEAFVKPETKPETVKETKSA